VAAVDAAAEALRDPERTPSAALLAALRNEQASFFEYTLALARSHAAYFRDFALAPGAGAGLAETARRSLEEAEALPSKDPRPFADYLRELLLTGLDLGDLSGRIDVVVFVIPLTALPAVRRGYWHPRPLGTGMKIVFLLTWDRLHRHACRRPLRAGAQARPVAVADCRRRERRPLPSSS
jgi:hypothetical protein